MTLSSQVVISVLRTVPLAFLFATSALAQVRQIDRAKLPQNKAVQQAYADLLPIDQFAQTAEAKWHFPVPKDDVAARFSAALRTLQRQQELAPDNKELQIFTGLVGHLAYNLEIEEGDALALDLLESLANEDFRADWFLGIHQCQTNAPVAGMQRLLHVETSNPSLPGVFWQNYANCAGTTNMPFHAVRAYDRAKEDTNGMPIDDQLEQVARKRIKPGDVAATYPSKQAWHQEKTPGHILITSTVCGEAFSIKHTFHANIRDVAYATCLMTIETDQYPSRFGPSSASMLLGTQIAKPDESLEAFAKRTFEAFSNGALARAKTSLPGIHCPVATCLSYEVISDTLYKAEGGAHLLAVFFQSDQPPFPGLRFETPQLLPKAAGALAFYHPEETLQRFNGTLYTFVTIDANQDIYPRARADFDDLLKSFVVDTK